MQDNMAIDLLSWKHASTLHDPTISGRPGLWRRLHCIEGKLCLTVCRHLTTQGQWAGRQGSGCRLSRPGGSSCAVGRSTTGCSMPAGRARYATSSLFAWSRLLLSHMTLSLRYTAASLFLPLHPAHGSTGSPCWFRSVSCLAACVALLRLMFLTKAF